MKNYIQPGDTITLTAPTNVSSGGGVLIGSIFGIASNDALAGAEVEAKLAGVFDMQKIAAEAWDVGDPIYWNQSDKLATAKALGNMLIGVAIAESKNPSSAGRVRLNGAFGIGAAVASAANGKNTSVVIRDDSANALAHDQGADTFTNSTSTKP